MPPVEEATSRSPPRALPKQRHVMVRRPAGKSQPGYSARHALRALSAPPHRTAPGDASCPMPSFRRAASMRSWRLCAWPGARRTASGLSRLEPRPNAAVATGQAAPVDKSPADWVEHRAPYAGGLPAKRHRKSPRAARPSAHTCASVLATSTMQASRPPRLSHRGRVNDNEPGVWFPTRSLSPACRHRGALACARFEPVYRHRVYIGRRRKRHGDGAAGWN